MLGKLCGRPTAFSDSHRLPKDHFSRLVVASVGLPLDGVRIHPRVQKASKKTAQPDVGSRPLTYWQVGRHGFAEQAQQLRHSPGAPLR